MKLVRTVHMGGFQAVYAPAAALLPDVRLVAAPGEDAAPSDRVLMFVDVSIGEAHAFMLTEAQAKHIADTILAPRVEVVRTFPGGMLNGDAA